MKMGISNKLFGLIAMVSLLGACSTNSVTGERHLSVVSEKESVQRGEAQYAKILQIYDNKGLLIKTGPEIARITRISNRLIDQAVKLHPTASNWSWDVNLIKEDSLNAWAMPGGKMAVYTALVEQLELNDDQLAAVIGHEISHALAGHGRQKMSVDMVSVLTVGVVAAVASHKNPERRRLYNEVGFLLSALAITLPNSRAKEYEADKMGLELMARAGFDPSAAAEVWVKMSKKNAGDSTDFFSTHPSDENRIDELRSLELAMIPLRKSALADAKSKLAPNPWISNASNNFAQFSRADYMASIELQRFQVLGKQEGRQSSTSNLPHAGSESKTSAENAVYPRRSFAEYLESVELH